MVDIKKQQVAYETHDSAGFDIRIAEDVYLYPKEYTLAKTGLYLSDFDLKIKHYKDVGFILFLMIVPRSSTYKYGVFLVNTPAIIDCDYEGEIKLILQNITNSPIKIPAGTRLAQGIFLMGYRPENIQVKDKKRGEGGFGSTGDK